MRTYRSSFSDPYSNNPYLPRGQVYLSIHSGEPAKEGSFLKPFLSLSGPLAYDLSVHIFTDKTEYKQANYRGDGDDYKELDTFVTIPAGETRVNIPIEVFQNEDPYDLATEYTLIEIDTISVPNGIKVGTGSARLAIVDVPTWETAPEILKGTRGNDHFPGKPGDQIYVGKGGHEDQINYTGPYSSLDKFTIYELPDGSIELESSYFGNDQLFGIEFVWMEADFQLIRTEDLFTVPNIVEGTNSSDILWATDTIDHLFGNGGKDYLIANIGNNTNDVLDGGDGYDAVVYINPGDIDLYDFVGKGGSTDMISVSNRHHGSTDTLYNIEEVIFLEVDNHYNFINFEIHSTASLIA